MAHCRVLFVGTIENLFHIFEDCPDSLCESPSEIAFSYDYLTVYTKKDLLENPPRHHESLYQEQDECEFTNDDIPVNTDDVVIQMNNELEIELLA